ncbi:hypothetical protein K458DRAFT_488890 [Lentithecium fluviatile CBS 122367]|uniref:Rhodopsin domain-containing protein n=1 Tax=Lentithecium fluviatile CBS 122367 TaxID=1168545 RepID=A0A6G1IW54_9PLEO|nr:hypothetical protein K458DRAFT_488890 [Lentithecium fluviatile CBS 122367]
MSNLSHLGHSTIIVSWAATSLALVLLVISTATIIRVIRRKLGLPDYLNFAAFLIGVLLVTQNTQAIVNEGQAKHQGDLLGSRIDTLAKLLIVHEALWTVANTLIRLSTCLFLLGIFEAPIFSPSFLNTCMALTVMHAVASILDLLLICRPISAQWREDLMATCGNQRVSFITIETLATLIDCLILALPTYRITRMKAHFLFKVRILCIMDLGAVLIVISALRLKSVSLATSPDFIYSQSYIGLLSALGVVLGVSFCAIPNIVPLFARISMRKKAGEPGDEEAPSPGERERSSSEGKLCSTVESDELNSEEVAFGEKEVGDEGIDEEATECLNIHRNEGPNKTPDNGTCQRQSYSKKIARPVADLRGGNTPEAECEGRNFGVPRITTTMPVNEESYPEPTRTVHKETKDELSGETEERFEEEMGSRLVPRDFV